MKSVILAILTFIFSLTGVRAAEILSPFAGSEMVGVYETDFVKFHYLVEKDEGVETMQQEGRLISRIYRKPAEKSNYEIFRSYENELTAAGFEKLASLDQVSKAELLARSVNSKDKNNFLQRHYTHEGKSVPIGVKGAASTQGQEYFAARKMIDQTEVVIVVNTSRNGDYILEQFETAIMEKDTVTITLEALKNQLADEGRIAIYGIHFETGSAVVKQESGDTLAIIVDYLRDHPEQIFYVVGHTDDQGELANNMTLSEDRAKSVVAAVTAALPQAKKQLIAHGVGPLSPVATNGEANGRKLNRRVELVSTHH